jgi:hypothetical protein
MKQLIGIYCAGCGMEVSKVSSVIERDKKAIEIARKQLGPRADYKAVVALAQSIKENL